MTLYAAFFTVIIIWSTTPLAVKWSALETDPFSGIFFRIIIATVAGWLVITLRRTRITWNREALTYYMVNNLSFVPGLTLVYIASKHLNSGIISLLFGFSPIISSLLGQYILNEPALRKRQWGGFAIAITGLSLLFHDQLHLLEGAGLALILLIIAVHCFSLSSVLLKRMSFEADTISTTVGTLMTSLPIFTLLWIIFGNVPPLPPDDNEALSLARSVNKGWLAIAYLGIFGSIIGMIAYLYILKRLPPSRVALATLISPIVALYLSTVFEKSHMTPSLLIGAGCVLIGITLFIWKPKG